MVIGDKLKELRATKNLSQGDIEKRTGLLPLLHFARGERPYRSYRLKTPEKMARALEIPMYRLFTDDEHVKKPNIPISNGKPALNKKQDAQLRPFTKALSRMNDKDQRLLLHMASKMANRG